MRIRIQMLSGVTAKAPVTSKTFLAVTAKYREQRQKRVGQEMIAQANCNCASGAAFIVHSSHALVVELARFVGHGRAA